MAEEAKNILIIKPSSLGDIVLALPALTALRRNFPKCRISWLIRPEFSPLIENHPHLDDVIFFDRKLLGKAWRSPAAFGALLLLIRRLREKHFDVVIDLQGLFRTALLGWITGSKRRLGMANAREFGHIFYTDKISQDKDSIHLVNFYLKIVESAGASDIDVEFLLPEDPQAADTVSRLLDGCDIQSDKYVVFVPCSTHRDKCWPVERFAALAEKISEQFKLPIVSTGTSSEKGVIEKLRQASGVPIENFAGRLNLKELVVLLKRAGLVVSNDTGPGHIAAALGSPLVMIYGWSNPVRTAPYGRERCMAAGEIESRGVKIKSDHPKHSVKAVTLEQVYEKVCEQISSPAP
jgi:lipopolysaccharide heptosyltransferase I